jgi:hypothetical protein
MWLEREENRGSAKCSKFVMASKTATAIRRDDEAVLDDGLRLFA